MKLPWLPKRRKGIELPMCPNCRNMSLVMTGNDSFADFGRKEDGIVNYYTCGVCGCEVEAWVTFENEEKEE